jgi:hypothetical protein
MESEWINQFTHYCNIFMSMKAIEKKKKECKKCKLVKNTKEFYKQKQKGKKNGQLWEYFDSYCISCRLNYTYERSREYKQKAYQYKGGKCADCGLNDDPSIFDFHHLDPNQKDFEIGEGRRMELSEEVKRELDKCVLLCSNCHRRRHTKLRKEQKMNFQVGF